MSSKLHKQPQSTGQAETVVGYSLAPHTSLIIPFNSSTGLVVHGHGLTGLRKALCKSRLGYLYPCAGVPGQYESVALMLSHKMDFKRCANRDGFRKSSHIYCGKRTLSNIKLTNTLNK